MGRDSCLREFSDSLERVGQYPVNLVSTDTYPHRLQSYLTRLDEAQQRLCCEDGKAKLGFWTCEEQGCGKSCRCRLLQISPDICTFPCLMRRHPA